MTRWVLAVNWTIVAFVTLSAVAYPMNGPEPSKPVRAAVLEYGDQYTKGTTGAARLLQQAGFVVAPLDPSRPLSEQDIDALVFGSFASESPTYKAYVGSHARDIADFVKAGGTVVQFTQADQTEESVPFLPEGLEVHRCDEDLAPVFARVESHPLLESWVEETSRGREPIFPSIFGRPPNWESLTEFKGFRVLLSVDEINRRPVMLEAAHGKGRFIITSLFPDKVYNPAGEEIAPLEYYAASRLLFADLHNYVQLVRAGEAPEVVPTPPYKPPDPLPFVPDSFTLAVLPDTQRYCRLYPEHYYNQTDWIARNAKAHNIRYVLHLGDVTDNNVPAQWEVARKAMKRLDGIVPYAIAPGNHDFGTSGSANNRMTFLNEYFPLKEQRKLPGFGGVMERGRLDNSWHTFEVNGVKFLILALEFGPRDAVVAWANRVVAAHPEHRAILITHAYIYSDETIYDWSKYGPNQNWNPHNYTLAADRAGVNDGIELWNKLVRRYANFIMVISGHVLNDGLGYLEAKGDHGNTVHQMLVNYQMKKEGGEGFMRLIEFLPDGETVQIKAWSPSLNAFKTDPQNQFVIRLDPKLPFSN